MVEVTRVWRSFEELTVLRNVTFDLLPGDIHGLIGPNGVGKTTLLRIVAGLVEPSEGSVRVLGGDPTDVSIRTRIGWIPGGDRTFYLRLSGADNLVFFGRMYGLSRRQAAERATRLLTEVGLDDAARRPTGLYSKGMLKRLAVARALLPAPSVLLCDETTHDLDPDGAQDVRALITDLASRGTGVLWATQRLDELTGFADSVTVLSHEGVAFGGSIQELLVQVPRRSFLISTGLSDPRMAGAALDALGGVEYSIEGDDLLVHVSASTTIGDVVAALADAGFGVTGVNEAGSTVEAAYRHVLGGSQ